MHQRPKIKDFQKKKETFSPGFEPGTLRVKGRCDNHYTTTISML